MRPTVKSKTSIQARKVPAPTSDAKQLVSRRVNWTDKKELTEQQAVRRVCDFNGRRTWKLEELDQNNPVDVRAISPDGRSVDDFQVVRLWEQVDWQKLNTEGQVDKRYDDQEAVELFRKVLTHKGITKYSAAVRKSLVLLIDANPIESTVRFIEGIEDEIRHHANMGYKSVWVVGTGDSCKID
jgi:hypothetical protein